MIERLLSVALLFGLSFSLPGPAGLTSQSSFDGSGIVASSVNTKSSAREDFKEAATRAGIAESRVLEYLQALDARAGRYGVSQDKIDSALKHLQDVLEYTGSGSPFDLPARVNLVETALHNIARPTEIDQGYHPTCNITTVEVYVACRHPDKYAELVKQIATSGSYKTAEGNTVTPPLDAIKPGRDEKAYDLNKPNCDKRNHASQVFQMTVINGMYESGKITRNGRKLTDVRYILGPARRKIIPNGWIDLGEDVLIDGQGKPIVENGEIKSDPGFTVDDNVKASKLVLGYDMPYLNGPSQEVHVYPDGRVVKLPWKYDLADKDRLQKALKDRKMPMGVSTRGGAHVQTIHDVQVDKHGQVWVLIDNQNGASGDGWVKLEDLHRAQKENSYELKPTVKPEQRPE